MNVAFRIIWSEVDQVWVVVSEHTKSKGKSTKSSRARHGIAAVAVLLSAGADTYAASTELMNLDITSNNPAGTPGLVIDGVAQTLHMYQSGMQNTGDSKFTTIVNNSNAIQVTNGAGALLEYTNITTNGSGSTGILADAAGSTVTLTDSHLLTTGAGGVGAYVSDGAQLNITGGTVSTQGFVSNALSIYRGANVVLNNTNLSATGGASDGIYATDVGSSVVMNGGAITSTGTSVSVYNGAAVELNGTAINNTKGQAVAVAGNGSNVTLNNVDIVQTGTGFFSVRIDNGANLTMTGGSLLVSGVNSGGFVATGSAAFNPTTVNITGTQIETAADAASTYGLQVANNVNAALNQAAITTRGAYSFGIWQTGLDSITTVTDTTIHTFGTSAVGVVNFGGVINVNGGSVVTEGQSAHGLYAVDDTGLPGPHVIFNANNVNVTTNGNAHGSVVLNGAEMAISGSNIISHGDGVAAAFANGGGIDTTKLSLESTQLTATGAKSYGLYASNGAQVQANNVAIHTTGNDSYGVRVVNDPHITLSNITIQSDLGGGLSSAATQDGINKTINVSSTTVAAQNGNAIASTGGSVTLNVNDSNFNGATLIHTADNVINNVDGTVTTIAAGTTNLNASNSYLNGAIGAIVDSGTLNLKLDQSTLNGDINVINSVATANLDLINHSLFKGAAHDVDQLAIDSNSNWLLTGDSIVNTTTNGGTITFDPASSFKTLSTNSYVGNGGKLVMNTALGDDNSDTDKLVINGGHASGTTDIIVNNAGGTGAQTNNGILLVEAINGGTTDTAAFKLGQDVRAGAYDYRLFRSGLNGGQDDNWYLRSTFDGEVITNPGEIDKPTLPIPPAPLNIYGPELSVYGAVMPTASRLGQVTLGTLHERVGEQENLRADGATTSKNMNGAWGRLLGQSYKDRYASIVDPSTNTKVLGFQIGADIYRNQQANGARDHAGVYFGVANADADISGTVTNVDTTAYVNQRTGNINLAGVSGGAYWTHYGASGWYSDAVFQATSYSGTASTNRASIGVNGTGVMASLEGGYPLQIGNDLSVEPQAQVIYQHIQLDSTADQFSTIGLGASNSLLGRLGARLQFTSKDGEQLIQPYARANLWSTMSGANNSVDYGGVDQIQTKAGGKWAQIGVGITAKVTKSASFYANIDGMFKVGGKDQSHTGVQVGAGFRANW